MYLGYSFQKTDSISKEKDSHLISIRVQEEGEKEAPYYGGLEHYRTSARHANARSIWIYPAFDSANSAEQNGTKYA